MLTNKERADKLREAIALLMDVDALQEAALGASDVSQDNHFSISTLIEDFMYDVQELEAA